MKHNIYIYIVCGGVCVCVYIRHFSFTSICEGGIADSVSKWVFRHNLAPERLKEILQKKEDKDADDKLEQTTGEEQKEQEEKSQEDADRTAGQD